MPNRLHGFSRIHQAETGKTVDRLRSIGGNRAGERRAIAHPDGDLHAAETIGVFSEEIVANGVPETGQTVVLMGLALMALAPFARTGRLVTPKRS